MTNLRNLLERVVAELESPASDDASQTTLCAEIKAVLAAEPAAPQLLTAHEAALGMLERYIADPAHPPGFKYRYTVKGWEHWQQVNRRAE